MKRDPIKPTAPIATLYCYIDTIRAWFPDMTAEMREQLTLAHGYEPRIRKCMGSKGWTVSLQTPQPRVIEEASALGGRLQRVDFAFDWHSQALSSDDLHKWVIAHVLLRGRKAGLVKVINGETTYWVPLANLNLSPRDLVLYSTKRSKLWGNPNAIHLELRLRRRGLRAVGLIDPLQLLSLGPSEIFRRDIRVVSFDVEQFRIDEMRKYLRRERRSHFVNRRPHARSAFAERYRAGLRKRFMQHWTRLQCEYAQRVHDEFPNKQMNDDYSLITLPDAFTWGASKIAHRRRVDRTGPH